MAKSPSAKMKKASVATVHKKAKFSSAAAIMKDPFNVMPMTRKQKKGKKKKNQTSDSTINHITGKVKKTKKNKHQKAALSSASGVIINEVIGNMTQGKNKEVKMVWSLPCETTIGLSLEYMPWCHFTTDSLDIVAANGHKNDAGRNKLPVLLQKICQNTQKMAILNLELKLFGQYVQLTNTEIEARRHVVQVIEQICRSNLKQVSQKNPIQVRTFGSFASLDVCTYASDVDISIWGAVEPPTQVAENISSSISSTTTSKDSSSSVIHHSVDSDIKQQRLQRWRDAIAHVDFSSSNEQTNVVYNNNASDAIDLTKEDDGDDKEEYPPIFVIDRKGQVSDDMPTLTPNNTSCNATNSTTVTTVTTVTVSTSDEEEKEEEEDSKYYKSRKVLNNNSIIINRSTNEAESSDVDDVDPLFRFHPVNTSAQDNHKMEVGFIWLPPKEQQQQIMNNGVNNNIPMTTKARKKVLSALYRISGILRRHPLLSGDFRSNTTPKMEVRRFAKVPILAFETNIGVEGDVAIGDGHNGTDTSGYASTMNSRYRSFAPVVLLLKILLKQADLDKPFTGGIGSYKLYVMVAFHLERHVGLNGGNDDPSEVLLAFFYRYCGSFSSIDTAAITPLRPTTILTTNDGGMAEMRPVFRLAECEKVFQITFQRLVTLFEGNAIDRGEGSAVLLTVLGTIICAPTLSKERDDKLQRARNAKEYVTRNGSTDRNQKRSQDNVSIPTTAAAGKVSTKKIAASSKHFFPKNSASTYLVNLMKSSCRDKIARTRNNIKHPEEEENTDDEADRLMAGYGVQRGSSHMKKSSKGRRKSCNAAKSSSKKAMTSKKRKDLCSF